MAPAGSGLLCVRFMSESLRTSKIWRAAIGFSRVCRREHGAQGFGLRTWFSALAQAAAPQVPAAVHAMPAHCTSSALPSA